MMWIPVTERLPVNGEMVLVYSISDDIMTMSYFSGDTCYQDDCYNQDPQPVGIIVPRPSHWMKLPEGPK
jgi:hypothetical protein